jgi:predicted GTPase
MSSQLLEERLDDFNGWCEDLRKLLVDYYAWLKKQDLLSPQAEEKLRSAVLALNTSDLTIVVIAESSRGKTHLINAIFFADFGFELLPSTAGRTTMCPVEIFYDHDSDGPYLKALPLETLDSANTLSSYKQDEKSWAHFPLDFEKTDALHEVLSEVSQTRLIPLEQARSYGFDVKLAEEAGEDMVEVPKWRHVQISFSHSLLWGGLRVIDTPGFNTLGSEPELIFSLLPSAHAVLFLLGADVGATSSDMSAWNDYVRAYLDQERTRVIVALNKIDSLWGGLQDEDEVMETIRSQREATAELLNLPLEHVYAVSAQKALVAKVNNDEALLDRSGLLELEAFLSEDLLAVKREVLMESVAGDFQEMLTDSIDLYQTKRDQLQEQREELGRLSTESKEMIGQMLDETKRLKRNHRRRVTTFVAGQKALTNKSDLLARAVDLDSVERVIERAQERMRHSWTTGGVRKDMMHLFDQLNTRLNLITELVDDCFKMVKVIYQRFETDQDLHLEQPRFFSTDKYHDRLNQLSQEAESFQNSGSFALLSGKNNVIYRVISELVNQARLIFVDIAKEAQGKWLLMALEPVKYRIRDHRDLLNRKGMDLKQLVDSRGTIGEHLQELDNDIDAIDLDLRRLRRIQQALTQLLCSKPAQNEKDDNVVPFAKPTQAV